MPSSDSWRTEVLHCGHCGNRVPMKSVAKHTEVGNDGNDDPWVRSWELMLCPTCTNVTLLDAPWCEPESYPGWSPSVEVIYPCRREAPSGLPDTVLRAFTAAMKVRNVDANAFGVLLGRVLELVCENRGAQGHFLGNKLVDLASRGEIPGKLAAVAEGLKDLRNAGAHPSLGELTPDEVPVLEDLTRALLEYLYSAPILAQRAEERLASLKAAQRSS